MKSKKVRTQNPMKKKWKRTVMNMGKLTAGRKKMLAIRLFSIECIKRKLPRS